MVPFPQHGTDNVSDNLRTVLKLPRECDEVADYLFCGLRESNFHPAHTIPPASLSYSLALDIQNETVLKRGPLDPPAPAHATVPPEALAVPSARQQQSVRDEEYALFLPVAAHPPYSFGYTLVHKTSLGKSWEAIDVFPDTFVARYALHTGTHDVLCASYVSGRDFIGLRAVTIAPDGARETILLSTPGHDYSAGTLPTTALWSMRTVQYSDIDSAPDWLAQAPQPSPLAPDAAQTAPPQPPAPASELVPMKIQDGASPFLPRDAHASALAALANAHVGVFYSPMMQFQFALGPAAVTSCRTSTQDVLSPAGTHRMRSMLADTYYANVLSVCVDSALSRGSGASKCSVPALLGPVPGGSPSIADPYVGPLPNEGDVDVGIGDIINLDVCMASVNDGEETTLVSAGSSPSGCVDGLGDNEQGDVGPAVTVVDAASAAPQPYTDLQPQWQQKPRPPPSAGPRPIQPRPAGMPIITGPPQPQTTQAAPQLPTADELAQRVARSQARRQRNRMAAARSNEKRRVKHEGLKSNIARERERARELLDRLRTVTAENAKLRQELLEQDKTS